MAMKKLEEAASTVDDYIDAFPPGPKKALKKVRAAIRKVAPDAAESIAYGMPAYKLEGKPLVYFAGQAVHLGLYALPEAVEAFKLRLADYKTSKGTIQFPYTEDLPIDLIEDIVRFRVEGNRAMAALKRSPKGKGK